MLSVVSYQEQIAQIAIDVFHAMLRMEVSVCETPETTVSDAAALVRFEGSWNGALLIQCSFDQAFEFAGRLMRIDRPTWFNEDAADALGEVANMIGGNLKALLPPKTVLSVPEVFPVTSTSAWPKDHVGSGIKLQGEAGVFSIALLEQPSSAIDESEKHVEEKCNG